MRRVCERLRAALDGSHQLATTTYAPQCMDTSNLVETIEPIAKNHPSGFWRIFSQLPEEWLCNGVVFLCPDSHRERAVRAEQVEGVLITSSRRNVKVSTQPAVQGGAQPRLFFDQQDFVFHVISLCIHI